MEKISHAFIKHTMDVLEPFFQPKEAVRNEYENNYYDDFIDLFAYSKLRSLLKAKIRKELFKTAEESFNIDIRCCSGLLTFAGGQVGEYIWEYVAGSELPLGDTPFWVDRCYLQGSQMYSTDDLLDYYLSDEQYLYATVPENPPTTFAEWAELPEFKTAITDIQGWFKKEYGTEMACALIADAKNVLDCCANEEINIDYFLQINAGIVPFLKFVKSQRQVLAKNDKPIARFALKLIGELKWPNHYFPFELTGIVNGYTENLFWTISSMGTSYDSTIFPEGISFRYELALMAIDFFIIYLDQKYQYLPDSVRELYL